MEIIIPTFFFFLFFYIIQSHAAASFSSPSSSSKPNDIFPKEAQPIKSGFLPVNSTSSSSIFYAFYEAKNSTLPLSETPLLIWLQGGHGTSSMLGNFYEVGPWRITESLTLEPNPASWNRIFGVLFLDNPIGTGFSVASSSHEIPTNQKGVAKHLFSCITWFLQLDPVLKHRPIYLVGQSYGGKYVTAIGHRIMKENARLHASQRVNLAGVAIGNGATEPMRQVVTHADTAYHVGLINRKQKKELKKDQSEAVKLAQTGNWSEAAVAQGRLWKKLQDMTGLPSLVDTMRKDSYHVKDLIAKFLNISEVKKALGINESQEFNAHNRDVKKALHADTMKSVKRMVEELLKGSTIKVLLYQGQYDLIAGPVQVEAWVKTVKWEGIVEFMNAERKIWKVNGELAGYVQQWKSLTNVVVMGGGHAVPADQPLKTQAMIEDWVLQRGIFGKVQSKEDVSINSM